MSAPQGTPTTNDMTNKLITIEYRGKHMVMTINDAINACKKHDDRKDQGLYVDTNQHAAISNHLASMGIDYTTQDTLAEAAVAAAPVTKYNRAIHPARMVAAMDCDNGDINNLLKSRNNAASAE